MSVWNRTISRPHRPRSAVLRRMMTEAGIPIPAPCTAEGQTHDGEGEGEEEEMMDGDPIVDATSGRVETEVARDETSGEMAGLAAPTSRLTPNTVAATSGLTSDTAAATSELTSDTAAATGGLTSDTAAATGGLTSEDIPVPVLSIVPARKKPKRTASASGDGAGDRTLNPEAELKCKAEEFPSEVASESKEPPKRKADCKPNPDPPLKKATPLNDPDLKKVRERDDGTGP